MIRELSWRSSSTLRHNYLIVINLPPPPQQRLEHQSLLLRRHSSLDESGMLDGDTLHHHGTIAFL